jgi:hypothetical protein
MARSLLRLIAAFALAALVSPISPSAAPAPGIAYDEIVRVVIGATPPPAGNFQADLATITSPGVVATASPAPKRGIGFGNIAKAVLTLNPGSAAGSLASDVASNAMENALQQSLGAQFAALDASIRGFLQPHVLHYAYYNGWERVDDVAASTATIRKCDMGQVYKLDLAKKTYSIYDPASEPTPAPVAAASPRGQRPQPAGSPAPPGTAVADISATTKSLGALRIENQNTTGYNSTAAFSMTQATGSCRNGSASITTDEYFSALNRPAVTSCPIRRAPIPTSATEVVAPQSTGGCKPTLTFHTGGPALPAGKLSLYTLVTMNGSGPSPAPPASPAAFGGVGFLTERGNIKTLDAADVALFSVPADFTKTP